MTDERDREGRNDVLRAAARALESTTDPDAQLLAAVHDGLASVPAGSPSSWFDVPTQRSRVRRDQLHPRRSR